MSEVSLIPKEAREMIGKPMGKPVSFQVLRKEIERYAHAVGDENPLYFDPEYARLAGYRDTIPPPLFEEVFRLSPEPLSALREDGLSITRGSSVPLGVDRIMAGGEEMVFHYPIYPDDTLTRNTRLFSLTEKKGRSGPFVLLVRETIYTNQDGICVLEMRSTSVVS